MSSAAAFRSFELPAVATFADHPGGLVSLRLTTTLSSAELFLHGAHVTHFQPARAEPVIFVSRASHFAPGKAIRGGVPICFPWFGPRAGQPEAPMHGFARTRSWELESLEGSAERGVSVVLRLTSDEATRALWPCDFVARYRLEMTHELAMTLTVENTGTAPFTYEEALHTYFAVSDVRQVSVRGLENAAYIDKTDALARKQLGPDPLRFTAETDRVFPQTTTACTIDDSSTGRKITIEKTGSATTVVWNPWIAKAAAMADFADAEWSRMLCIETANTGTDAVTLPPGTHHSLTARISAG